MRIWRTIAACTLMLAEPAWADITARYASRETPDGMIVQVSDRGDSRVTHGTTVSYLTIDGTTYMLLSDAAGTFVARQEDFGALLTELTARGAPAPATPGVSVTPAGRETVAGRNGAVFRVGAKGDTTDRIDVVIDSAPDLAPIGRILAGHLLFWFETMGAAAAGLSERLRTVLDRGTILRLGPLFRLESVDTGPVPPSAFELPSAPLGREALVARLGLPATR